MMMLTPTPGKIYWLRTRLETVTDEGGSGRSQPARVESWRRLKIIRIIIIIIIMSAQR